MIYLVDETGTTDGAGNSEHTSLTWDAYDIAVDGEATGYDIKETNLLLPLIVDPGVALDLIVTLVEHTDISLHLSVTTPDNQPVDNASVLLTGNGVDEELGTGVVGQVMFGDLPVDAEYAISVDAPGFESYSSEITVEGTTRVTIALTPL